jgi:hypothetical protein
MSNLKIQDRNRKYNIVDAFEYILNESNPRMNRAIRLYELQVVITLGSKLQKYQLRKHEKRNNWVRVSRATLMAARMVSRTRLLEYLIQTNYPGSGQEVPFKKLVRDREALGLLRQIITPNKSKYIAYSRSWKDITILLTEEFSNQKKFAPLYHVSLNFALYGGSDSRCIWSRAKALLEYTQNESKYNIVRKYFKNLESLSTAYKYKRGNGNHFAVFMWLDHFGDGFMRAIHPVADLFAEKLLAKVDDTMGLRTYLAQYAYVRSKLAQQEYLVPELWFAVPVPPQAVSFDPLPGELTDLI